MSFEILCSGITLGVYNPAIMLSFGLQKIHEQTDIYVLEGFFKTKQQNNIPKLRVLFHQDYNFAKTAQRMNKDIATSLDEDKIQDLLFMWKTQKANKFIVFSGYWMHIVKEYKKIVDNSFDIQIYICLIDVILSNSWSLWQKELENYIQINLFNLKKLEISFSLTNHHPYSVEYKDRCSRLIIHGGGWGMGTYQDYINELTYNNISLIVVCYDKNDRCLKSKSDRNLYLLSDPEWYAWDENKQFMYPPIIEINEKPIKENITQHYYPGIHHWIGKSKAIISKPGGGTLLDSYMLNTPLIFLQDGFGDWEAANAEFWIAMGFGISYKDWKKSNFNESLLSKCYNRITEYKKKNPIPLLQEFLKELPKIP
jgi:hypothetical protein